MTVSGVLLKRSIRTAVLAATLASAALPHALSGQTTSATIRPINLAADIIATLQREHDALVNPQVSQAARDEAADRLLSHRTAVSRKLLLSAAANLVARPAVARALKDDPVPDAESIGLLKSWLGTDEETTIAAAHALAAADKPDEALVPLLDFINTNNLLIRDPMRAAAVRGLGSSADIRAARALGALLIDKRAPMVVRNAACDALVEMTGLTQNGRDIEAWKKWVQEEAGPTRNNKDFRDRLVDLLKRRQQPMPAETMELLGRLFQQIRDENKSLALKVMLTDPQPGARIVGIRVFEEDGNFRGGKLSENMPLVADLINDSAAPVRQQVAKTLGTMNKKETAEALMTQLALETEPAVKAEIIHTLAAGMSDIRVVPQLLILLNDPSERVRLAAADALRTLGATIKQDAALAKQVATALKGFIAASSGDMKAAGVDALVPLADSTMLGLFKDLLDPHETPATRRAALRGLATIGDPKMAGTVIQLLSTDKDESVRLAALETFARVGSFAYHDSLFKLTKPADEPDALVRRRAWEVFQELLPTASPAQLQDYAELFRKSATSAQDPREHDEAMNHRLAILLEQERRDQDPQKPDLADLAAQRENIGSAFVQLHQPEKAVPYFRQALDYWLDHNARGVETETLIGELMDAYLDSKQYAEAAKFADATIARNPEQQRIVAARLRNRAQDLLDPPALPPGQPRPAASPRDALQLASEALTKINPVSLEKNYREALQKVQAEAARRLAASHTRPAP